MIRRKRRAPGKRRRYRALERLQQGRDRLASLAQIAGIVRRDRPVVDGPLALRRVEWRERLAHHGASACRISSRSTGRFSALPCCEIGASACARRIACWTVGALGWRWTPTCGAIAQQPAVGARAKHTAGNRPNLRDQSIQKARVVAWGIPVDRRDAIHDRGQLCVVPLIRGRPILSSSSPVRKARPGADRAPAASTPSAAARTGAAPFFPTGHYRVYVALRLGRRFLAQAGTENDVATQQGVISRNHRSCGSRCLSTRYERSK
ncbi:hypothetical protein OKW42_001176 [Paraburkholderia sp. WC7.3d]